MSFKEYLVESLLAETKVKVGSKEFSSKREAAIAMAEAGKNAEFIMKAVGTTEAMARHFVSKYGKKNAVISKTPIKPIEKPSDATSFNAHVYAKAMQAKGINTERAIIKFLKKEQLSDATSLAIVKKYKDIDSGKYFDETGKWKTESSKTSTLDKLKTELKRAEDELKKLGKRGGSENDAYVLTLKKKIKDIEGSTKKEVKEPVKNKAQERREILDAYKKGEKYKPEPLELASLDKEKSRIKAKDWMKKHVDDHSKKKDLKDTSKADIKDASRADTRKKDLDEFKKMLKKEDELESAARKEDSDTLWDELDDLRSRIHKKGKEIFNKYNIDYRDFHGDNFQYVK